MNNQTGFDESIEQLTIKSSSDVFSKEAISMESLNEHEDTEKENENFDEGFNSREYDESNNNNDGILSDISCEVAASKKDLKEHEESEIRNKHLEEITNFIGRIEVPIEAVNDVDKEISESSEVSKQNEKTLNTNEHEENLSNFNDDLTIEERINILQAIFAFGLLTIATSFTIIVIQNVPLDPVRFPWTIEIYQPQNSMLL